MTGSNPPFPTSVRRYGKAAVQEAAVLIRSGLPVAVATETVYGLAADATNGAAVARIYAAKGRPSFNPLIVHVATPADAATLARVDPASERLMAAFWPGPLTLVMPLAPGSPIAGLVTAGLPTVALRCPAHPAMHALLVESGRPLAAPSANPSGKVSATTAGHVLSGLDGRIPMILDSGPTRIGIESTIAACGPDGIRLLRPGPITAEHIAEATGYPVIAAGGDRIEAPGQLSSHYAPAKPVRLDAVEIAQDEFVIGFGALDGDLNLSPAADLEEAAARLFDFLHRADEAPPRGIAIRPIPRHGLGIAINDRLARAAHPR